MNHFACIGKERFETHALAERIRKVRRNNSKLARQVYRCRDCGGYHIGTSLQMQAKLRGQSYITARERRDEADLEFA